MRLYITTDGTCQSVYDETLDLEPLGSPQIRRASHVEPTATGTWMADLSPMGGPTLGPFAKRSQALQAEAAWLQLWFEHIHGELYA